MNTTLGGEWDQAAADAQYLGLNFDTSHVAVKHHGYVILEGLMTYPECDSVMKKLIRNTNNLTTIFNEAFNEHSDPKDNKRKQFNIERLLLKCVPDFKTRTLERLREQTGEQEGVLPLLEPAQMNDITGLKTEPECTCQHVHCDYPSERDIFTDNSFPGGILVAIEDGSYLIGCPGSNQSTMADKRKEHLRAMKIPKGCAIYFVGSFVHAGAPMLVTNWRIHANIEATERGEEGFIERDEDGKITSDPVYFVGDPDYGSDSESDDKVKLENAEVSTQGLVRYTNGKAIIDDKDIIVLTDSDDDVPVTGGGASGSGGSGLAQTSDIITSGTITRMPLTPADPVVTPIVSPADLTSADLTPADLTSADPDKFCMICETKSTPQWRHPFTATKMGETALKKSEKDSEDINLCNRCWVVVNKIDWIGYEDPHSMECEICGKFEWPRLQNFNTEVVDYTDIREIQHCEICMRAWHSCCVTVGVGICPICSEVDEDEADNKPIMDCGEEDIEEDEEIIEEDIEEDTQTDEEDSSDSDSDYEEGQ